MFLSIGDPARYYLILRNVWNYDEKAYRNIYDPALLGQHLRLRWLYFLLWIVLGTEIWFRMFIEGNVSDPVFDLGHYL
jgi:hypothetical protein